MIRTLVISIQIMSVFAGVSSVPEEVWRKVFPTCEKPKEDYRSAQCCGNTSKTYVPKATHLTDQVGQTCIFQFNADAWDKTLDSTIDAVVSFQAPAGTPTSSFFNAMFGVPMFDSSTTMLTFWNLLYTMPDGITTGHDAMFKTFMENIVHNTTTGKPTHMHLAEVFYHTDVYCWSSDPTKNVESAMFMPIMLSLIESVTVIPFGDPSATTTDGTKTFEQCFYAQWNMLKSMFPDPSKVSIPDTMGASMARRGYSLALS